ncbi:MAG: 2-amino-3,7-dideoxy-D-threo-hept-6-ulosonate synthase [Candidatus Methanofastidiosia archaeon]
MDGKELRMRRISKKKRFLIVPMDHGVSVGAVKGIENMDKIVQKVSRWSSAVLVHKGIAKNLKPKAIKNSGLIVHLSASTNLSPDANYKVLVGKVEDGIRLGADALSIHVNVGGSNGEPEMLKDLSFLAFECFKFGMPLLAMMYARGKNVKDSLNPELVSHVARIGAELGADIVKCNYTGSAETFKEVTKKCPVPVVIAGGPKVSNNRELLEMVYGSMEAHGCGISIGRNIFQHENPTLITKVLSKIIFKKWSVEEAMEVLNEKNIF